MSDCGEIVAPPVEQPMAETRPRPHMETKEAKEKEVKEESGKDKDKHIKKKKSRVGKPRLIKAASHPPYFQMIKEAIMSVNEKSGSSPHAIAKFIEGKHKSVLPANFRKMLSLQLKNSVAKGKLVKVRASYKLSQSAKTEKPTKTAKTKPATARKKSTTTSSTATTKAARANAAKPEETAKTNTGKRSKRPRSKSAVNQIESKIASGAARRTKKLPPTTKARQPKSIKKAKKTGAA